MASQSARQKSSMMERLRRLRTLSAPPQAPAGSGIEKSLATAPRRTAVNGVDEHRHIPASKSQPRHREDVLDLEKLDSKLQEYANLRARDEDDQDEEEAEEEEAHDPEPKSDPMPKTGKAAHDAAADAQKSPDPEAHHDTARLAPVAEGQAKPRDGTIEIIVHPPEQEEPPEASAGSSDYELFLEQAKKDERLRQETGQPKLPRVQPLQPNQFYANDRVDSARAKLGEIQESDETSAADNDAHHRGNGTSSAESGPSSPERPALSRGFQGSSSCGNSGSHDFAGTPEAKDSFAQTTFVPPRPGRHVSFCEPLKPKDRSDSYCSAYHVRGYESPQAPASVAQRRSIREMMATYIRQI